MTRKVQKLTHEDGKNIYLIISLDSIVARMMIKAIFQSLKAKCVIKIISV